MSNQRDLKKLFQIPAVSDKLNLLHLLFEGSELSHDLALALLKVIHRELGKPSVADGSVYKQYAGMIQLLQYHQPEMLQKVVNTWKMKNSSAPDEWFDHGNPVG
jgi:hypothetical protein